MEIQRYYQNLENYLEKDKVLLIFGPRRVGKTTLVTDFINKYKGNVLSVTGDDLRARQILSSELLTELKDYVAGKDLLFIDEAQRIPKIGWNLKLLVDHIPNLKIIATGSASFELAGQVGEPLTGRKTSLLLYPIAQTELRNQYNSFELKERLNEYLVYGSYPNSITAQSTEEKRKYLEEILNSFLLKDILELEQVKGSNVLLDLLRLIAFQVGSEVSLSEIANKLNIDIKTVQRYLDLFEKSFILYNLRGYSRNLRNEVTKKSKYFFLDNGIRNAVISNFNPINARNDVGQLWENFLVSERLKKQEYSNIYSNNYFWRTWEQQEVDWIEERDGKLHSYEFKHGHKKTFKIPSQLMENYPDTEFTLVNEDNYQDFIL